MRAFALGVLLLCVMLTSRDARAEAFDVNDTTWEGGSELLEIARAELGATRVVTVAVLNWDEVTADDGVLAIHPMQAMDAEETTSFMAAGGRLAICDDYGAGDETLKRYKIERTSPPSRPVAALRNRPSLAIAEPYIDVVAGHSGGPHPVVAHVQQLVTNHPTGLRHPGLSPVLRIRAIGEPDAIIAVAGQVKKGRLFAMSDPSAMINEMLRYPGNRAFVAGLVRYLVDEESGKHGRLFIVTNRFHEEGAFGGKSSLRKDLEGELKSITNALADARRDGLPGWMHLILAGSVALAVAFWVARASARPYKIVEPRYARRVPLIAQGGVAGRFAMLAAPSTPRSLALLELKSALFEALVHKLSLASDPTVDGVFKVLERQGALDEATLSALKEVLAMMQEVEAAVVAGRAAPVSRAALVRAAAVVRDVLNAVGANAGVHGVPRTITQIDHQPSAPTAVGGQSPSGEPVQGGRAG